jgi:iron only hydrogenase large subunit-like protein
MFSLTDDFLSPGEVCIKPIQIPKKSKRGTIDGDDEPVKASISLTDCLACSGCVTSAESVLIASQSTKEFSSRVASTVESGGKVVVSISPESRASIAAHFGLSLVSAHRKLVTLFKMHLGAHFVFDMQLASRVAVLEARLEFEKRFLESPQKPVLASSCPGWICFAEKSHPEALPYIRWAPVVVLFLSVSSFVPSPSALFSLLSKSWASL